MNANLNAVLEEARKLPIAERRELAELILEETSGEWSDDARKQIALAIVEETFGAIKGIDRNTLIWLAEDEEFCGY